MHDSRMIAEVVPPGCCAIEKVSGSRIATPFAPPSPGSTPMITPSTMPANISARFLKVSATAKPWIRDWTSSISYRTTASIQPEQGFKRSFGQRHLEPDLEDQEEGDAVADAHRGHLPPRVFAEPAHEKRDEKRRGDINTGPSNQRNVDRGRHEHGENQLELPRLDENPVAVPVTEQRDHQVHRRGHADDEPDVEREVAGLRPVLGPTRAEARAVEHHDRAQHEKERRDCDLGALVANPGQATSGRG